MVRFYRENVMELCLTRPVVMMKQSITLNLPYDLSSSDWSKVLSVYQQMNGWIDNKQFSYWFGTERDAQCITASVEPSGLVVTGNVSEMLWLRWLTVFCARLTLALGKEIHDARY